MKYWYLIVLAIILIANIVIFILNFTKMSKSEKIKVIRGWLLQAVVLVEKQYGHGTGPLKLSVVYDMFCARFPWAATVITYDEFSSYVDKALEEMKKLLEEKPEIAKMIEGET